MVSLKLTGDPSPQGDSAGCVLGGVRPGRPLLMSGPGFQGGSTAPSPREDPVLPPEEAAAPCGGAGLTRHGTTRAWCWTPQPPAPREKILFLMNQPVSDVSDSAQDRLEGLGQKGQTP